MKSLFVTIPAIILALVPFSGCSEAQNLSGNINIQGSSTVQPISNKAQELFNKEYWKMPALECAQKGLEKMRAAVAAS